MGSRVVDDRWMGFGMSWVTGGGAVAPSTRYWGWGREGCLLKYGRLKAPVTGLVPIAGSRTFSASVTPIESALGRCCLVLEMSSSSLGANCCAMA